MGLETYDCYPYQSSSDAGTSSNPNYQGQQQASGIADNIDTYDKLSNELKKKGLENANLIVGIDFTKNNQQAGLHAIGNTPNAYEQVITAIGRSLSDFSAPDSFHCFGFGDESTRDGCVFSFYSDRSVYREMGEALARYKEIVPRIKLSGPTSFAPIIDTAIDIVLASNWQYHVLLIIAAGQVTVRPGAPPRVLSDQEIATIVTVSLGAPPQVLSDQEIATIRSINEASEYPLSILLVGVGDGPWDAMEQFETIIHRLGVDNFKFVKFTEIMSNNEDLSKEEVAFASTALSDIPQQYRTAQKRMQIDTYRVALQPLPPPPEVIDHVGAIESIATNTISESSDRTSSTFEKDVRPICSICVTRPKDLAFGCGHVVCEACGVEFLSCPMCRKPIKLRLKLYDYY